jgi:MSHA biogenesis protein MshO
MNMPNRTQQSGFTLVEMIMVIVITGIIGGMVAVFLKAPIQQYMDVARRAELTDIADTAVRRMARDVRLAVPNSVRVPNPAGISTYIEFLPTKDGGRYHGKELVFDESDTDFIMVSGTVPVNVAANDYIVIGSTQSDGAPPYDQTVAGVLRKVSNVTGAEITFAPPGFPQWAELASQRFSVVDGTQQAVTYACEAAGGGACATADGNGTCQLKRYWKYGFYTAQQAPPITVQAPVPPNAGPVQNAILADKISACEMTYDVPNQRFGLLAVRLTLTSSNESVSLYNEIHVNNAP